MPPSAHDPNVVPWCLPWMAIWQDSAEVSGKGLVLVDSVVMPHLDGVVIEAGVLVVRGLRAGMPSAAGATLLTALHLVDVVTLAGAHVTTEVAEVEVAGGLAEAEVAVGHTAEPVWVEVSGKERDFGAGDSEVLRVGDMAGVEPAGPGIRRGR